MATFFLALQGCGGGGGGGSDAAAPDPVGGTGGGGTGGTDTGGTGSGGSTGGADDGGSGSDTGGGDDGGGTDTGGTDTGGTGTGDTGGGTVPNPGAYGFNRQLYVDNTLGGDCLGGYNVDTRRCAAGADTAFSTFAAATAAAQPGDQFLIREGDYQEVLRLRESGTATAFIGFAGFPGELVTIRDVNSIDNGEDYGPIWLDGVSYNVIERVSVTGSVGFLRAVDAHYNVIDDCDFDTSELYPSESKRGGLYFAWSTFNKVLNSRIVRGTDSLSLIRSDNNLVSGNTFELAGHDVWVIKCGSENVIRGNNITNPAQKLGSVFDCELGTSNWHGNGAFGENREILDRTKRNLVEGNVFDTSTDWYSSSGGNGIQYAGQEGVIRRNVFVRNNVGLGMTQYDSEALYNYSNRVYNNVFHENRCGGIFTIGADGSGRLEDNLYKNNALWNNRGWHEVDGCDGIDAGQLLYRGSLDGHRFIANGFASEDGTGVVREEFGGSGTVQDFSNAVSSSVVSDPRFTNAANGDYTLAADSPLIDQGDFLTVTSAAGSGTELVVDDVLYFYDGFGIPGEMGDRIQLAGDTATARVVAIDYDTNTLTLDSALSWSNGQGVALAFAGSAPDIGVYER